MTACGNGIGLLGDATAGCAAAGSTSTRTDAGAGTGTDTGTGTGTGIAIPVIVCGNAVGSAGAACDPATDPRTGTVDVPVTVCGNVAGLLGSADSTCGATTPISTQSGSGDDSSSTSTTPSTPVIGTQATGNAVAALAAVDVPLAFTGAAAEQLMLIALLALLVGLGLLVAGRRRSRHEATTM
ncbi:MAG: hypothetical protein JO147_10575 [Actinobacteria bacterium]|nr:hypothetical protein [Actinomycetota bacterium]